LFLLKQLLVKSATAPLPLGGMSGRVLGVLGFHLPDRRQRFGAHDHFRPAIDHQQQENQRPHGAEQDGQEWKGGDLE
jgi:hypothetical protein